MLNNLYCVGGFVRDVMINRIHGTSIKAKDLDFCAEVSSYSELQDLCKTIDSNCKFIYRDTEEGVKREETLGRLLVEFNTINLGWSATEWYNMHGKLPKTLVCDVLITRKESGYSDGRHPDYVQFSTLEADLLRRDFRINSLAVNDTTDELLDISGSGLSDIRYSIISTVREPFDTFSEHIIRVLRCLRFSVEKNFDIDTQIWIDFVQHQEVYANLLRQSVFENSINTELTRMMKYDTIRSIELLYKLPYSMKQAIFSNIWLKGTTEKRSHG